MSEIRQTGGAEAAMLDSEQKRRHPALLWRLLLGWQSCCPVIASWEPMRLSLAMQGGLERKQWLLHHEGYNVLREQRMSCFGGDNA